MLTAIDFDRQWGDIIELLGRRSPRIIDLFAGPGGWDVGLEHLGRRDLVGVEWDDAACDTRRAAGLPTLQGDVAELHPADFARLMTVEGLIASPPCQSFSQAGNRGAARDSRRLREHAIACHRGWRDPDPDGWADPRSALVLQPLRWADALRPEWVALEQVPQALPMWEASAVALEGWGYEVKVGYLWATDYGVPQRRKRAFLIGSRVRRPEWPRPTHGPEASSTRRKHVSMASALGWGLEARPAATICGAGTAGGGPRQFAEGGARARSIYTDAIEHGEWVPPLVGFPRRDDGDGESIELDGEQYRRRDLTSADGPALTVTKAARSWRLVPGTYATKDYGHRREHTLDEPAPTIAFGNDDAAWQWVEANPEAVEWVMSTGRDWQPGGDRLDAQTVPVDQPAPTITAVEHQMQWMERRRDQSGASEVDPLWPLEQPATTIMGRDTVADPGQNANRFNGKQKSRNDGYRVTVAEAGVLQSFPAWWPWQGSESKQYEQVGNAVPPRLAAHVLAGLLGVPLPPFADDEVVA